MSDTSPLPESQQLARKSVYGVFWNYASFGASKLLVFLTTATLARLLTPDDFGIVAFATLAVDYLSILKDLGLGVALIQRRDNIEEAANTVFTLNLLLGTVLTLSGIAIAPFIASFFREPLIIPVLRWLSLTFILNALGSVHIVRLQRELEFRRKLLPDLGRSLFKGIACIGLAWLGSGVWSLVVGQLVGVLAGVILAWVAFPWRPRLVVNTRLATGLLGYGMSVVGVNALAVATDNLDYLIVGRLFGNTDLGIYTLAFRLPELLVLNPLWVMAATIFPAYATIQHQPEILRRGFLATVRFVEILCVPLAVGLALVADPLVRVAFGDQWLAAIPIVRILALFVLVRSIGFNAGDVYKAIGRPDVLVKLEVLNMVILVPALWYGAHFGLVGVACGHLAAGLVRMTADAVIAARFIRLGPKDILLQLKPSFWGGLALALGVVPSLYLTADAPPILRLALALPVGASSYLGVLWFLEQASLLRIGRMLGLPGLGKGPQPASLAFGSTPDAEAG